MTGTPAEYGAAWLDEHRPGWADQISLERLDISQGCHCILGQLYPTYGAGISELPGATKQDKWDASSRLGFDTLLNEEYHELTAEWSRLVADRQTTHNPMTDPQEVTTA